MKIFDCFMYFDEDIVLDLRLNYLDKYVDKFVIVESIYSHKGERRKPQFNINKFEKFKEKIIYLLVNEEPNSIKTVDKDYSDKKKTGRLIMNALRRENFQRNYINNGLSQASDDDWIIISDLDEIPDLKNYDLKESMHSLIFFKQLMIYYKFNLVLENYPWIGSRACKKNTLNHLSGFAILKIDLIHGGG